MKRSCGAALALGLLALADPAAAQRANANAVADAADAFGFSKAGDAVGLYNSGSVRGFSPTRAGNLRMEGLYLDRQAYFTGDLIDHSRIHVGLTALEFPFPAPSGISDYGLKSAEADVVALSVTSGRRAGAYAFLDLAKADLGGGLSFAGGASLNRDDYPMGGGSDYLGLGGAIRYRPGERLQLRVFGNTEIYRATRYDPTFYVAGAELPGPTARYDRLGQAWAAGRGRYDNAGVLADARLSSSLSLRAGLFRSVWISKRDFDQVFDGVANGRGALSVYAYPERKAASWSGEARLIHDATLGPVRARTILAVRGRAVDRRLGGEAVADLGVASLTGDARRDRPALVFGPQLHDAIDQYGLGAQTRLVWPERGQLSGGLERVRYEKVLRPPAGVATRGVSEAWLYNLAAAWRLAPSVTLFAAANRGLEDTGAAPASAVNRGEVLPAILSTQQEAGIRVVGPRALAVTAAVFRLRKPFPGFSIGGRYELVGDLENRGAELSLSVRPIERLKVLAGLYLAKPELDGGGSPLGSFRRQAQLYFDYALPKATGASVDLRIAHQGATAVLTSLDADARTVVDLGARWQGEVAGAPLSLRLVAGNLLGEGGWSVEASGGLSRPLGRTLSATVSRTF
ncbi:MAG: TonB-dependent receptor [Alphaproteobacteria bacterium]|nr:TonB-dependent receptor [Alphaproteobacteria bacterium]MBU1516171.1 TonB-dependent receptor [Alphaproteobacteria bacterium]MBU2096547.1 TonB-dependent receptor [Alphaproteobacteria bacterium]MBU2154047.1 TonB-dependent receptor [Alphaproteobacteria bacterium]MBU2309689.1 TonB-dependent receptor [Alphaproteobacteria bacterium]